jgi:micrococcal nuclease
MLCIGLIYVIPQVIPLEESGQPLTSETHLPSPATSTITIRPERSLSASPTSSITSSNTVTPEANRESAQVLRVIDGDTIEVMLDGELYTLRYIGIDSPEPGDLNSDEAMQANRELVEGQVVELESDISETDQYGRLLRYVYLNDGTMVNTKLVEMGYAIDAPYPPDVKYQALITRKQEFAQAEGLGFWAPSTATATPLDDILTSQVSIDHACSQFNAPGNDNENMNEEYVCFVNPGQEPIDMSGWVISDQYGWMYTFVEYTLDAGAIVRVRSGCGEDSKVDLFWCRLETAVWNNDGDCVYLNNAADEMVGEYCY